MAFQQSDEILTDFSPFLRVYKDGRVERILGSPIVPPEEDQITGVSSKDITISPEISARLYLPKLNHNHHPDNQKLPILVYYHGGAFCVESVFSFAHQRYLNLVVAEARALCISVEYRLAPEHLLPAAYEDSWAALQWVASHLVSGAGDGVDRSEKREPWLIQHGDFSKVYLGGDSAGGNIVHNICMRAGVESLPGDLKINGGLLCFPGFWGSSYEKDGEQSQRAKIWNFVYPTAPGGIDNPMRNPLAEDAPSLSQMGCLNLLVIVAEKDELKHPTTDYVMALRESDEWKGKLEFVEVLEEGHCFQIFNPESGEAKFIIEIIASFINGTLFRPLLEFDGMKWR